MEPKFINREKEFKKIQELTRNIPLSECGKMLLLYSKAGIGKARLVDEYVSKYYPVSLKINVKIPTSKNSLTPPYRYFNSLFDQIRDCLRNNTNYKITPDIGFSFKFFSFGLSIEKISDKPDDINKKIKQMQKFFRSYTQIVIISIENMQSIDNESLEIIKSFLMDFPNIFMFLQYTIDYHHTKSDLCSIFEYLQEFSVCSNPVEIRKMSLSHILEIMNNINGKNIKESKLWEYYIKYDGNIDELIICALEENDIFSEIPYESLIKEKLSSNTKLVLYIILFYKGELFKDSLLKLFVKAPGIPFDYSELNTIYQELESYNIITIENTSKIIINNSAIKALENVPFTEEAYVAFSIAENDCYTCLQNGDNKTEALYRLIYMYFLFNDERIFTLLPDIKERLITSQSIDQIICQIETISNHRNINAELKRKLTLGIVDILYAIGKMQMAKEKLDTIFQNDNLQHEMYKLALLGALNDKDFVYYYTLLSKKYASLIRVELFCKYINLYHQMKNAPTEKAKTYAKEILDNKEYTQFLEYYFVLKNYSTYLDNEEAINALQKCVDAFEARGRIDLVIRTKITLAMRNANIGNLQTARKILKEADEANVYSCRECYFLNNFSVIDILDNNFSEEVENNLKNALLFNPNNYEQGIILCNLLIYYCKTKKLAKAQNIAAHLEAPQYYQYAFEQYNHIIHYNLYYYYSVIKDDEKMRQHYTALEKLYEISPLELKEYMDATIFQRLRLSPLHRRYYYSKYQYRPDYIGYWQLEIPNFTDYSPMCS